MIDSIYTFVTEQRCCGFKEGNRNAKGSNTDA